MSILVEEGIHTDKGWGEQRSRDERQCFAMKLVAENEIDISAQ
jgi:hypothetical protein